MDNINNGGYSGPALLKAGTMLHGKYEIKEVLGVGGFGITYSAVDTVLQTKVAVKEYFPSTVVSRQPDGCTVSLTSEANYDFFKHGIDRFLVEARDVAKFNNNPNIVSVYDYFEENKTAYMVMEYLKGMTLKQYFKAMNGNIPQDAQYNIASSVIYALSIIHGSGIIHRDISPENIYMCDDGTIKIIDFGAAKEDMQGGSQTVSIVLKQGYAPIEQYSSKTEIGPWTDIYAFGATLYYLATGVKPEVSIDRAISDNVCPPKNINPNISDTMNRVIMRAMAVRAQDRYRNVYDMSQDLKNQYQPPSNGFSQNAQPNAQPNVQPNVQPRINNVPVKKKFPAGIVIGVVVLAAIIAVVLYFALKGRDKEDEAATTEDKKTTESIYTTEANTETQNTDGHSADNPEDRCLYDKNNNKVVYVDITIPDTPYLKTEDNMVMFQGVNTYAEFGLYPEHKSATEAHFNLSTNPDMQVIESSVECTTDDGVRVYGSTFTWSGYNGTFAILTRELPDGKIMYVACQYIEDQVDWNIDYMKNMLSDEYLVY